MSQGIERIIALELESIETFIGILQEEQLVLRDGPVDGLAPLGEKKMALVARLNSLEAEREMLLPKATAKTAVASMEAYIKAQPDASRLEPLWHGLLERAREARDLHQVNAKILAGLLDQTDAAINVLRSKQQSTSLYGSDGQVSGSSGSRIVDLA